MARPTEIPPSGRNPPIPVDVLRGAFTESRHIVFGCTWGTEDPASSGLGSLRAEWGDASWITFMRSALKPFQVLPLLVDGVADELGFVDEELALATGSHSGQDVHIAVLNGLMKKSGVTHDMLQCGRHRPYHKDSARRVGSDYSALHNNCSGKHAAMLAWCLAKDVDPSDYLQPDHPLQRRILDHVSLLSGIPRNELGIGIDGCGVPTVALPLFSMARMFRFLGRPEALRETEAVNNTADDETGRIVVGLRRVCKAMQEWPLMVAGEERPDTDTISYTDGRLVTKAGAEGLWCGVNTRTGTGFAFKTIDGHFRATVPATLEVLAARRELEGPELSALEKHHRPVVKNHAGTPVGRIVPQVP